MLELQRDRLRAGVVAGARAAGAAHLLDCPAVQAQARFKAQRVARAEAGGLDLGLGEQCARERVGRLGGHRDLEPVLAGVAAAGDEALGATQADLVRGEAELAAGHERERRHRGVQAGQRGDRLRPLQREQRPLGQRLHEAAVAEVRREVAQVGVLAGGVDDEQQVVDALVQAARDHQVVEDAAGGVREQRVALLPGREADDVAGHQRLERRGGVGAGEPYLPHVRDVEQRRRLAALAVLGEDAAGVVDRHLVAGERHHLRAEVAVQRVQRGGLEGFGGHGVLPRVVATPPPVAPDPPVRFT